MHVSLLGFAPGCCPKLGRSPWPIRTTHEKHNFETSRALNFRAAPKRCGPDHAIIGMHTNGGGIYWTKFALTDLPNEFIGVEDLKSIVVDEVNVPTI